MLLSAEEDIEIVGAVDDGVEAIRQAHHLQPDVVLMDVRMPGLDGVEATRQIVEATATDDKLVVKVLILTTFNVGEAVYAALRAGASGFLLKDAVPDELVGAIRSVACGDAWLDPAVTRELLTEFAARPDPLRRTPEELHQLTRREQEVLILVAQGLSNTEIAEKLVVAETTVKTHLSRIMVKLGLRDRSQVVVVAYQSGLVKPGEPEPR
jgi:DNA-binding NarL/FixJ family response regulator